MINYIRFRFAKTNSIRSVVFIVFRDRIIFHLSYLPIVWYFSLR